MSETKFVTLDDMMDAIGPAPKLVIPEPTIETYVSSVAHTAFSFVGTGLTWALPWVDSIPEVCFKECYHNTETSNQCNYLPSIYISMLYEGILICDCLLQYFTQSREDAKDKIVEMIKKSLSEKCFLQRELAKHKKIAAIDNSPDEMNLVDFMEVSEDIFHDTLREITEIAAQKVFSYLDQFPCNDPQYLIKFWQAVCDYFVEVINWCEAACVYLFEIQEKGYLTDDAAINDFLQTNFKTLKVQIEGLTE